MSQASELKVEYDNHMNYKNTFPEGANLYLRVAVGFNDFHNRYAYSGIAEIREYGDMTIGYAETLEDYIKYMGQAKKIVEILKARDNMDR